MHKIHHRPNNQKTGNEKVTPYKMPLSAISVTLIFTLSDTIYSPKPVLISSAVTHMDMGIPAIIFVVAYINSI